jgi:DNA-directed RNA polymerase subunit RPC12/RpoP
MLALETYACPTHPEFSQDKPGACPYCGQKLVVTSDAEHIE